MTETFFTRSGSSPGDVFCTSGSSPTTLRSSSPALPFIPEFPFQCTGSFCHGRNIHAGPGKLCPPCREAKRRHNKTEKTRAWNVERINKTRRILRYNKRMEHIKKFPWLQFTRPRGLELFRRIVGLKRGELTRAFGLRGTEYKGYQSI